MAAALDHRVVAESHGQNETSNKRVGVGWSSQRAISWPDLYAWPQRSDECVWMIDLRGLHDDLLLRSGSGLLLRRAGRHGWLIGAARGRCARSTREEECGDDGQHGGDEAQRPRVAQLPRRVALVERVVTRHAYSIDHTHRVRRAISQHRAVRR